MEDLFASWRKFMVALLFTLITVGATWYFKQYWALLVGVAAGSLRVVLFWVSEQGEPFIELAIEKPSHERPKAIQLELVEQFETYQRQTRLDSIFHFPKRFAILLIITLVIFYFDRSMIFYCFFMGIVCTWMWFQWWLSWRVGVKKQALNTNN